MNPMTGVLRRGRGDTETLGRPWSQSFLVTVSQRPQRIGATCLHDRTEDTEGFFQHPGFLGLGIPERDQNQVQIEG